MFRLSRFWRRGVVYCAGILCVCVANASVVPLPGIVMVKAGASFNLALRAGGTVWAWGENSVGQLGDGTTTPSLTVRPVGCGEASNNPDYCSADGQLKGAVSISAGSAEAAVLLGNGAVLAWGLNSRFNNANNSIIPAYVVCGEADAAHCSGGVIVNATQVAAGFSHYVVLLDDGAVLAWGTNNNGNLGNNQPAVPSATPVQVAGLGSGSGVIAIATGNNYSFALKSDGTVVGWGVNAGQLGDNTATPRSAPVNVLCRAGDTPGSEFCSSGGFLRGVSAVSAGNAISMALLNDHTLFAWGNNNSGQVGDGTTTVRRTPVNVCAVGAAPPCTVVNGNVLQSVSSIVGSNQSLSGYALTSDGTVLSWGTNGSGQLGDGTTTSRATPGPVAGLGPNAGVAAVTAGDLHGVALMSDGVTRAWGSNASGQLGNGNISAKLSPVEVLGLGSGSGVIALASRAQFTLALKSDGTVLAWGSNANGQLGDGTLNNRSTPTPVACRAGDVPGSNFCSSAGQLQGVSAIANGNSSFSVALMNDGTVLAWGANANSQVGDGTMTQRNLPVNVCSIGATPPCLVAGGNVLQGITAIAAGGMSGIARTSTGGLVAWGNNANGFLGDDTTTARPTPVNVRCRQGDAPGTPLCSAAGFLQGVSVIAAAFNCPLALMNDGTVMSWGLNLVNQLGDGTTTNRRTPVNVCAVGATAPCTVANGNVLHGIAAVAGAANNSFALTTSGQMLSWGGNSFGAVGDGTTINRSTPVHVCAAGAVAPCLTANGNVLDAVSKIVGGNATAFAVLADGAVLGWGANSSGQIGDNTLISRLTPGPLAGLGSGSNVDSISAGGAFTTALKGDGSVLAWGGNGVAELADGTTYPENLVPTPVLFDDITPPTLTMSVSPDTLWPPNRKQVQVRLRVEVSDNLALPIQPIGGLTVALNEPGEPPATLPLGAFLFDPGSARSGVSETTILLRAELAARGRTRIYTLSGAAHDTAGHSTPFSIAIPVAQTR